MSIEAGRQGLAQLLQLRDPAGDHDLPDLLGEVLADARHLRQVLALLHLVAQFPPRSPIMRAALR
jgi:hypothetical protein